jgi:hypothetical protein
MNSKDHGRRFQILNENLPRIEIKARKADEKKGEREREGKRKLDVNEN